MKKDLLGVEAQTLENFGAVSKETVSQMIRGAIRQLKTDYVIVTTGIMGPDGGSADKPVGTVWIGVGSNVRSEMHEFHFRFDRQRNMELTATQALNVLRKFILNPH